jgi:hypothetical protein
MPILQAMLFAAAAGASGATNFGVRDVSPGVSTSLPTVETVRPASVTPLGGGGRLPDAAIIAARWGRVTSTFRSPEHNRRVGGVANSYHLSGRAIDIARRPGVRHWQIDAALRQAGFSLLESLDEGDHSHFAFSWGGQWRPLQTAAATTPKNGTSADGTRWRVVYAPR